MRRLIIVAWTVLPAVALLLHWNYGQEYLQLDDTARLVSEASQMAQSEDFLGAVEKYEEALRLLPPGKLSESRRLRLECDKARMNAKQLVEAHQDLEALVEEAREDGDPRLLADTRAAWAGAQYYMTWLMRLEGQPREAWEPQIEGARQTYRLLAEQTGSAGFRSDLEASIRLARMDLSELQGLPLPSQ